MTANSFASGANNDSMKSFADIGSFLRQVETTVFNGSEPPATDIGNVGYCALSERGVAVALVSQLSDSAF